MFANKCFYVILCMFYVTLAWAQENNPSSKWELKFTDRVMNFSATEDNIEVLFFKQAAVYKINKKRKDFLTIFEVLKKTHENKKLVEVTVSGTEIVSLTTNSLSGL